MSIKHQFEAKFPDKNEYGISTSGSLNASRRIPDDTGCLFDQKIQESASPDSNDHQTFARICLVSKAFGPPSGPLKGRFLFLLEIF